MQTSLLRIANKAKQNKKYKFGNLYEQDFIKDSYGYRRAKMSTKAIQAIKKELSGKYNHVVEADIKGFFNNINHEWLIRMLKERINDGAFIGLIKK